MTIVEPSDPVPGAAPIEQSFARLAEPFRRELKLHCYRMLGSFHDAEDMTQETYIRAWRSFEGFDGRGSLRAWLYRIATNVCLDALGARKQQRRLLPDQYEPGRTQLPDGPPVGPPALDVPWLEPYPDQFLDEIADEEGNPERRYAARESVQLAFVAAVQQLPPRQRAALLLTDVLGWSVAEAASLLDSSTAAINSGLQRARATLALRYPNGRTPPAALDEAQRQLVGRYMQAWERLDLDGFVALLREDATLLMPPFLEWYVGRQSIGDFHRKVWQPFAGFRLRPIGANRQPGFALYAQMAEGSPWSAHSLHILTLRDAAIATLTLFVPPEGPRLFGAFGLPPRLD